MKNLSRSQKVVVLIIAGVVVVLALVFAYLYIDKKIAQAPQDTNQSSTSNSLNAPIQPGSNQSSKPNSVVVPIQPTPKDYNQTVYDLEAKIGSKTITAPEYVDLAVAYQNLGKIDKAESSYNQALTIDPNNVRAYNNLGNIYRDKGDFVKSEQYYKYALSLDSKNYKIYINLAFLYNTLMNDKQKAIAIVNQGLLAIPDSTELKSLLEEYNK